MCFRLGFRAGGAVNEFMSLPYTPVVVVHTCRFSQMLVEQQEKLSRLGFDDLVNTLQRITTVSAM